MTTERWQQVEHLYYAALEREARERAAFLDHACAGDDQLRREVESLLAAHERAGDFLTAPALEVEAKGMATEQARSRAGQQLNHYRILERLGAGGMGEVYLAEDTRLDRKVALKLLPAQFTQDEDWLRRFVREAKAASALNHPNIIVIYEIGHEIGHEIGETGETHYIATEFIEGRTLRQQMKQSGMTLREAVAVATQVAGALAAAHAAGIVHRDIKPENIMVRADGLVKVLDFGLAKQTEAPAPAMNAQAATVMGFSTKAGVVMGTPAYMSPEQARGLKVDGRTDIFSLGAVLYEMTAGRAAFEGATTSDVIAAILKTEPAPLARFAPEAPAELERIIRKTMRKDREERYQVIKDLMLDLQSLKEELEFEAKLANTPPAKYSGPTAVHGAGQVESPIGPRRRRDAWTVSAALVAVVAGLVFAWNQWMAPRKQTAPFQSATLIRLTHTGKARSAAITPDGKYVVYAEEENGQQSLRLRQTATDSYQMIVPPAEVAYLGIAISPRSEFIYYVRREEANTLSGVLYKAPLLGGSEKKLFTNVYSPVALSPDGSRLAFVRMNETESPEKDALITANADGGGEKRIYERTPPNFFSLGGPAWSPDGGIIACGVKSEDSYWGVVGVRVADGKEYSIPSQRWEYVGQIAWLPDGRGLLVVAAERQSAVTEIWHLPYPASPDGKAHNITNELIGCENLSVTADSAHLVTVRLDRTVNIWVASGNDASLAKRITSGADRQDGDRGLVWTPDGKIVYRSSLRGQPNIWIMEADGTGAKQLSANARQNLDPTISPDGNSIVWTTTYTGIGNPGPDGRNPDTGIRNLWRVDRDGGNMKQLTREGSKWFPHFSPDGKWLVYHSVGPSICWKMPAEGGPPVRLTDKRSYAPVISPDGKLIACNYVNQPGGPIEIAIIPFEGGSPIHRYPVSGSYERPLRWTPDGLAVAYIQTRDGVSNIYSQALKGGPPQKLTDFKDLRIFNFAWSSNGKQLALSRGEVNGEVLLISNPR